MLAAKRMCWIAAAFFLAAHVQAQNWDEVQLIQHSTYQAVNADGTSAYALGFPTRLRGVILNNPEDWLDPTADYTPEYVPWYMGGEWEIFVQASDDPNETYDDGDFGGTACWMGQNYGNLGFIQDPERNYTNEEWEAELERLNYPEGPGSDPIRAGDLIEVRARGGLNYQGKMNVNEQHNNDPAFDFEIVLLERGHGLPEPEPIMLSDLLVDTGEDYEFIWDPTRATGGEHYQSTRILIKSVQLLDPNDWGSDTDLVLIDSTGRTLDVHLGRNPSFDEINPPTATFNLVCFLNQASMSGIGGYYALVMHAADFVCGDADCDGVCDFADINPFVQALTDPDQYAVEHPGCMPDLNGDFVVDFADINPFVQALLTGVCP